MIISSTLSAVPFISSTDTTRLQMAGKQLAQSLTHLNCERPYTIGSDYKYLTLNQGQAEYDGEVVYKDNRLLIVVYYAEEEKIESLDIPEYLMMKDMVCTRRRYAHPIGKFKKGDTLFEYDAVRDGVPSFGYNLNVAYFPFFSLNCEDAVIMSETAATRCMHQKVETVLIPVYSYSAFKGMYPLSKYKFIPEKGHSIDGKTVFTQMFSSNTKKNQVANVIKFFKYNEIETSDIVFNSYNILTKLEDAIVEDISIHSFRKVENYQIHDKDTRDTVVTMAHEHSGNISPVYQKLQDIFGKEFAYELICKNYYWSDLVSIENKIDFKNLQCIIEVKLISEQPAAIGDKFANRYANKGVISHILPDELCPYVKSTGERIDYIINPLSVFNRMNFGQILELITSKAVKTAEFACLSSPEYTDVWLSKLSKLASTFGNQEYADEITKLASNIAVDDELKQTFLDDVEKHGMYFEAPSFVSAGILDLINVVEEEFALTISDDIVIPVETFEYMAEKFKDGSVIVPEEDVILENVFTGPSYILALKHLAQDKLTARDFGKYSQGSNTPCKVSGFSKASKVGNMEADAFISHNTLKALKEIRTVKCDIPSMKHNLVEQILLNKEYHLPDDIPQEGIKVVIENLIEMVNS